MVKSLKICAIGILCLFLMMGAAGECIPKQGPFDPGEFEPDYPGSSYRLRYGVSSDPDLSSYDSYYDMGYEDGYYDGFYELDDPLYTKLAARQCGGNPDTCGHMFQYSNGYDDGHVDGYSDIPINPECGYGHVSWDYMLTVSNRYPRPDENVTVVVSKIYGYFPLSGPFAGRDGIELEVRGTDGYYHYEKMTERTGSKFYVYDSRGNRYTYYNAYKFTVPGAGAGVDDKITVKITDPDTGKITRLCITAYFDYYPLKSDPDKP